MEVKHFNITRAYYDRSLYILIVKYDHLLLKKKLCFIFSDFIKALFCVRLKNSELYHHLQGKEERTNKERHFFVSKIQNIAIVI